MVRGMLAKHVNSLRKRLYYWRRCQYHRYVFPRRMPEAAQAVWIASFPRSGSHWLLGMMMNCLESDFSAGAVRHEPIDVLYQPVEGLRQRRYPWLKTHLRPLPYYRKLIYLYRHPAEVHHSYWRQKRYHRQFTGNYAQFVVSASQPHSIGGFGRWDHHLQAYQKHANHAQVLFLSYERLLCHTETLLTHALAFSGFDQVSPAKIDQVAAAYHRGYQQRRHQHNRQPVSRTETLSRQRQRARADGLSFARWERQWYAMPDHRQS